MNNENTQYLFNKYPLIFADKDLLPTKSLMCFGFECGDGWLEFIDNLCEKLQKLSDEQGVQIKASQVKEKFGTLRFYTNDYTDEMHEAISEAEKLSSRTCDVCGKEGKLRGGGWVRVLCDYHEEK